MNMTKNLIPLPQFEDRLILDSQNDAWDNLGQRTVKGFVLHRMLGSLTGTDQYFRQHAGGLTDYGTDNLTGKIYRWNDPLGLPHPGVSANRSGWASGRYNVNGDAYGDGRAFVVKYGLNGINRDQVSWEIDGFYGDPWSDTAMKIAAIACAHYAHNYGIPWDKFPIAPQDGFSFVRWHQEFTGPAEKLCPGAVVMNQTSAWIEIVRVVMKAAQTDGGVLVYASRKPIPPPLVSHATGTAYLIAAPQTLTLTKRVTPRQYAGNMEEPTGPDLVAGDHMDIAYVVKASDGNIWAITKLGDRIPISAFA